MGFLDKRPLFWTGVVIKRKRRMKSMEESTTKTVTITSDTDFVIAWQNGTFAR